MSQACSLSRRTTAHPFRDVNTVYGDQLRRSEDHVRSVHPARLHIRPFDVHEPGTCGVTHHAQVRDEREPLQYLVKKSGEVSHLCDFERTRRGRGPVGSVRGICDGRKPGLANQVHVEKNDMFRSAFGGGSAKRYTVWFNGYGGEEE